MQHLGIRKNVTSLFQLYNGITKNLSTTSQLSEKYKCELLVIGGGSGGCSTAAKFASHLGKNKVIIVEPTEMHYYQPMFTLVGGGMKKLKNCGKSMSSVLPSDAKWIKDEVIGLEPTTNRVITKKGHEIEYNFMVVAVGLKLDFHKVKGLEDALSKDDRVCSNYSPKYVSKTYEALKDFQSGNAIFTFPNSPIKCAGAPQKIMYIAEHFLRKVGKRDKADVKYFTSLGVIFGVKKYADALWKICRERDIDVTLRHNLIEVKHKSSEAIFQNLDAPDKIMTEKYSLLHVTPPMSTPEVLSSCSNLVDAAGYLQVDRHTLRNSRYKNIFGIGDCTNAPTSKTAAAVAAQSAVLKKHLQAAIEGKEPPKASYDGYTSCPLITGYDKCILAEFDYDLAPLETFPIDQGRERKSMFLLKKVFMPELYWRFMLKGHWGGPKPMRKLMHLGFGK